MQLRDLNPRPLVYKTEVTRFIAMDYGIRGIIKIGVTITLLYQLS